MIALFRNAIYRKLFWAQAIALVGTGILTIALALLAVDVAGDYGGIVLGVALTIKMVAYVGVAPVMSALTSHLPRKAILIGSDILRAVVALLLPFVSEVWQIYVLIFILQAASATFTPTFQALLPEVVPDEGDYTRALSLSRLAADLETLVSPILAALLLTLITYNSLFVATVVGFICSALFVSFSTLPAPTRSEPSRFFNRLTRGVKIFWGAHELRALLAMNMVVASATSMVIVNTVIFVQDHFGRSQVEFSLALASYGLGSMLVSIGLPRVLDRIPDRRVMLVGCRILPLGLASTALIAFLPVSPAAWSGFLVVWFILGAASALILTPAARLLRRNSDATSRSAVFAAQFSLSHSGLMVAYPLAGTLGVLIGLAPTALILATMCLAAALVAITVWKPDGYR